MEELLKTYNNKRAVELASIELGELILSLIDNNKPDNSSGITSNTYANANLIRMHVFFNNHYVVKMKISGAPNKSRIEIEELESTYQKQVLEAINQHREKYNQSFTYFNKGLIIKP